MDRIDDAAIDDGQDEETALCPCCLTPNRPEAHFCLSCGTPMSSFAEIAPIESILARGDTFRKAAARPTRTIMLIGMWLLFGPQIPFFLWWFGQELLHAEGIETAGRAIVAAATISLYVAILWKVTRNYIRLRRETPQAETETPEDDADGKAPGNQ